MMVLILLQLQCQEKVSKCEEDRYCRLPGSKLRLWIEKNRDCFIRQVLKRSVGTWGETVLDKSEMLSFTNIVIFC